ncbi:MAG TPA: gliding motility protein RemB, partial [Flavobacterium sp.]
MKIKNILNKSFLTFCLALSSFVVLAQETNQSSVKAGFAAEQLPVFPNCENLVSKQLENCFYKEVQDFVYENFQIPENLKQTNYKGEVKVLFEVDANGSFKVIYVNAVNDDLVK